MYVYICICMYVSICVGMLKYVYMCISMYMVIMYIMVYYHCMFDVNINNIMCKHELPHVQKHYIDNIILNTYTLVSLIVYVLYIN